MRTSLRTSVVRLNLDGVTTNLSTSVTYGSD